jgi:hypothetical protein
MMKKIANTLFFATLAATVLFAGAASARQLKTSPKAFGVCRGTCSATVHCSGTCFCWIPSGTTGFCVQDPPGLKKTATK